MNIHPLYDMTPFRSELIKLLPAAWWAASEMILALTVIGLSFMQNSLDHTHSDRSIFGVLSYFTLMTKAIVGSAIAWDGMYAMVHQDVPRPIVTCVLFVVVLQQVRLLTFQKLLHRTALGGQVLPPYYTEESILPMPVPQRSASQGDRRRAL